MKKQTFVEGQTVKMRGILADVSSRFWSGGWSFGTLRTVEHGSIKITGTLEGHVKGTCLSVTGTYKEDARYGAQIACTSIVVESVGTSMEVIRAWAEQAFVEDTELVERLIHTCYQLTEEERWPALCEPMALVIAGFEDDVAKKIGETAAAYLRGIAARKELMELGFTNREADRLFGYYGDDALELFKADPYQPVVYDVVSFGRVDAVMQQNEDISCSQVNPARLVAAVLAALRLAARNGHTALPEPAALREAAQIAGVYADAIERVVETEVFTSKPQEPFLKNNLKNKLIRYEGFLQLPRAAQHENSIAKWLVEAARKTAEEC